MGHSNVRIKARRRKVANLAAQSRKHTTRNVCVPPANKKYYTVPFDTILDKMLRFAYPKVGGKTFVVDKDGHFHVKNDSWKYERHEQTPSLITCKKRKYSNVKSYSPDPNIEGFKEVKREKRNNFVKFFPNYPYTLPKMNHVEYMEKLVQHKLAKWERKNPKPINDSDKQADLFEKEFMIPWQNKYEAATERIRDFVISIYDKLPLTGRFEVRKSGTATYQDELLAELKDINGDGHHINDLDIKKSKLVKKAQKITNKVHAKRSNLICSNLKDHKRTKGRIILPQAA